MANKERLDALLVDRGLAPSREKAKAIIMSGNVFVDGEREDKPGTKLNIEKEIIVKSNPNPYVSRGGLKLDKAMKEFDLTLEGKTSMDVGASTGGFTDCMLQKGAIKVYAIDVGYGQFAWKLRQDERVVCMEKTNIRYVTPDKIDDLVDFVSIDVSFISLRKVLEPVSKLMNVDAEIVCLIKPQFEAGREKVGKKGVVRDRVIHEEVIQRIMHYVQSISFYIKGLSFSPIKGPEGNIEYLLYMTKVEQELLAEDTINVMIKTVVDKAHEKL